MHILPLERSVQPSSVPLDRLEGNATLSEGQKIAEASRQFEAILLRQIFQQARKTIFPSDLNKNSATSGIYQDMINDQLADGISRSGSFGLAKALQAQLIRPPAKPSADPLDVN